MKGKERASDNANDGTDEVPGRYSIFDLEGIDNSNPVRRYTIFELAQRLLQLAIFEETNGTPSLICIQCLRMAMGERPCPHGHFPEDPRRIPRLVWPGEERTPVAPTSFTDNRSLLSAPPGRPTCRAQSGHGAAPPASPIANRPSTPTPVWHPCPFNHQHSLLEDARACREQAVMNTYEFPPPAATSASVHRRLQVAMGTSASSDVMNDARSPTSTAQSSAPSAIGVTRSGRVHSAIDSRVASPVIGTSSASVAASRPTTRSARYTNQPTAEAAAPQPAEHPLVPIPEGANPIPVESINIDDENPAVVSWYIVTTGSTVGVFDDVTVAQRAARVSGGSWRRCNSRQAALAEFRRAVARNIVVVRL
ncbi:hypothetical protein LXA43DRAFT_1097226 [Ganoderma leucocontextum]|nr:hypothetical protein LXA43DRAFT_1097226 [Ganoderma leucocontextum]